MAALVVSIRFQDGADLSPFLRLLLLLLLHWLRLSTFDGGRKTAALFLSARFKMAPIILPPSVFSSSSSTGYVSQRSMGVKKRMRKRFSELRFPRLFLRRR